MFNTINTGMSGLIAYSKGLQTIGNNLTNVNTPGFKGVDQEFSSLFSQQGSQGDPAGPSNGSGIETPGTHINFNQGQVNQTGNPLDVALNGQGFFILRQGSATTYTRAGQFEFNKDGILVQAGGTAHVAGLNDSGTLQDISLEGFKTNPGKVTTTVKFSQNLAADNTADLSMAGVNVFDAGGGTHALSLTFHNNATPVGNWTVTVKDENGATVGTGTLQFTNGNLAAGASAIALNFTPRGMAAQTISLDFSGVQSVNSGGTSSLSTSSIDGHATGNLRSETFDASGTLVFTYSNGETIKGPHLALAGFDSFEGLSEISGNAFISKTAPHLGIAGSSAFGTVGAGTIEGSNVDLSQQFSNLIIMQRGYQAASQIVSVSNELIQTLLDMRK